MSEEPTYTQGRNTLMNARLIFNTFTMALGLFMGENIPRETAQFSYSQIQRLKGLFKRQKQPFITQL